MSVNRQLSPNELFFHECSKIGVLYSVQAVLIKGKLLPSILQDAMCLVMKKYKILQQIIVVKEEKFYFKTDDTYAERWENENFAIRARDSDDQWKSIVEDETENGASFIQKAKKDKNDETGLLHRLVFVYHPEQDDCEIIFGFHHSILDGAGVTIVINALLDFYVQLKNNESVSASTIAIQEPILLKTTVMAPPKVEICALPVTLKEAKERSTWNVYKTINKDVMSKILSKCKENGTTFNSALLAAAKIACTKFLFKETGKYFTFHQAVSLRNFEKIEKDAIGLFISSVSVQIKIDENSTFNSTYFWTSAKSLQGEIKSEIEQGLTSMAPVGMHYIPDKYFEEYPFCRTSAIGMTNWGVVDQFIKKTYISGNDCLEIKGLYFSTSFKKIGALFVIACATLDGNCHLTYSGCVPLVSQEIYESLVSEIENTLQLIIQ